MPNYVYSEIEILGDLSINDKKLLSAIEKAGGICNYYHPMPKSLNISSGSGVNNAMEHLLQTNMLIPKNINDEQLKYYNEALIAFDNIKTYGFKDWYDWKIANYGTKWGDVDFKIENNIITYSTAWSPLKNIILEMFAVDFPNFNYEWIEENGYGIHYEIKDDIFEEVECFDAPDVEEIQLDDIGDSIYCLLHNHRDNKKGFYSDWNISKETWLSDNLEDAIDILKNEQ